MTGPTMSWVARRPAPGGDAHPARWRMLVLLSAAELLGMSLWFTASAVSPQLRELWGLSAAQAGWLTTVVQLGFVAGTACAAVLNVDDHHGGLDSPSGPAHFAHMRYAFYFTGFYFFGFPSGSRGRGRI